LLSYARGARRHEGGDGAGGQRLREFGGLDGHRLGADQFGDARGLRAVGAPLDALQVGAGVDRLGREDALRWPGHGEQHPQTLLGEQRVERGLLRGGELFRFGVGRGKEGHVVGAEQRVLVGIAAEQDFADLRLAALYRALDLVGLVQRTAGMDGDLELAGSGLVHVGGKLGDIFGVEIGGRVGRGHVPLGLGRGGQGGESECGNEGAKAGLHMGSPPENSLWEWGSKRHVNITFTKRQ
jgi:hypothetical protein